MNTDYHQMETIRVPVIIETNEDGIFIVSCPQFKGCHMFGKIIDEALAPASRKQSSSAWKIRNPNISTRSSDSAR